MTGCPDDGELLAGQGAGLLQDGVGNADLADIVQVSGQMDDLGHAGRKAHAQSQDLADNRHFLGMGAGPVVLGVHSVAQGFPQVGAGVSRGGTGRGGGPFGGSGGIPETKTWSSLWLHLGFYCIFITMIYYSISKKNDIFITPSINFIYI